MSLKWMVEELNGRVNPDGLSIPNTSILKRRNKDNELNPIASTKTVNFSQHQDTQSNGYQMIGEDPVHGVVYNTFQIYIPWWMATKTYEFDIFMGTKGDSFHNVKLN